MSASKTYERHPGDPRPELVTDHKSWQEILLYCWQMDKPLYYLLHGIRCGGAGVTVTRGSFRLQQGQWSVAEWEDIKTRLSPFRDKLVKVFKATRVQLPLEFLSEEMEA
ncbi:MAG: hypothetical protein WA125_17600 [Desulfosporosinus sp.]